MNLRTKYAAQGIIYLLAILFIGYLSNRPYYRPLNNDQAIIKLSFRHSGKLLSKCRQRSEEELAALPPNMRIAEVCPRERSPILVELLLNNKIYYRDLLQPAGIHKDGMASLYKSFVVPSDEMKVEIRMKDHIEAKEFNSQLEQPVTLKPNNILVIDFKSTDNEFIFIM